MHVYMYMYLCMCVYVGLYTAYVVFALVSVHVDVHVLYMYTYSYVHRYAYMYMYRSPNMYNNKYMHTHSDIYVYMYAYMLVLMILCMHICMHEWFSLCVLMYKHVHVSTYGLLRWFPHFTAVWGSGFWYRCHRLLFVGCSNTLRHSHTITVRRRTWRPRALISYLGIVLVREIPKQKNCPNSTWFTCSLAR